MTQPPIAGFPLRLGGTEIFAQVRSTLAGARFDEATLCEALKLRSLSDLGKLKRDQIDLSSPSKPLPLLIKLFLLGEPVSRAEFEAELDALTREAFEQLDLVRRGDFAGGCYYSPVFLYPVEGFLIVSDRQTTPDGSSYQAPQDMVFAALFPGTSRFLQIISPRPAGDALDLCSGTGIGALKLSRSGGRVVASDITERSGHFIRFNAVLNGCANVEVAIGDLYDAVAGQTFDQIVAHPPYVPSLGDNMIFRDGGDTGETIIQRIVEGLPGYLRPGGTFYSMGAGLDTRDGRFEERARRWLGSAEADFDVLFGFGDDKSPDQAVNDIVERARSIKTLNPERLAQAYQELGTLRLVYGALIIHRRLDQAAASWTARPRLSIETRGEDFDWFLEWHSKSTQPGFVEGLREARPTLSPHLQVKVTHVVEQGALVPSEFLLETKRPFATVTRFDPWVVPLIAQFDGQRTLQQLHEFAKANGQIPGSFALGDFAKLVALLVERGYLALPNS
jgi:SAM-dependent methyltransferase